MGLEDAAALSIGPVVPCQAHTLTDRPSDSPRSFFFELIPTLYFILGSNDSPECNRVTLEILPNF